MQGTWENGQFVLASTKDDKISRLESEAAAMREKIKNQAARIRVLEGATNHAGGLKTDEAIAVLREIANEDYRGNRSSASQKAHAFLLSSNISAQTRSGESPSA